jgi:hypothetical protein
MTLAALAKRVPSRVTRSEWFDRTEVFQIQSDSILGQLSNKTHSHTTPISTQITAHQ